MSGRYIDTRRNVRSNNDPMMMTGVQEDSDGKIVERPGQRMITGPSIIIRAEYAKNPHVKPEKQARYFVNRYEMLGTPKMPSLKIGPWTS